MKIWYIIIPKYLIKRNKKLSQESRAEERRKILREIAFTFEEEYSIYNYDERRREEEEDEEDIDFHEVDKYDENSDQE